MKTRLIALISAVVLLVGTVCVLQFRLQTLSEELADNTDRVALLFSEEKTEEGFALLSDLEQSFSRARPFFGLTVSDAKIHEIDRALFRARRLGEEGETSPVLEALSDLAEIFRELSETHSPKWENIL